MSESRWVQHISGSGKQYLVHGESNLAWRIVLAPGDGSTDACFYHLPKEEYHCCEPSEQWVDVTATCDIDTDYSLLNHPEEGGDGWRIFAPAGFFIGQYRLRKIEVPFPTPGPNVYQWVFIVERRAP